jgi:hypothetical protein
MLFNNLKRISGVTGYMLVVTLDIRNDYGRDITLPCAITVSYWE